MRPTGTRLVEKRIDYACVENNPMSVYRGIQLSDLPEGLDGDQEPPQTTVLELSVSPMPGVSGTHAQLM